MDADYSAFMLAPSLALAPTRVRASVAAVHCPIFAPGKIVRVHLRLHDIYSIMNRASPYSTGWPFSLRMALTTPTLSDSISFIIFMASMMHKVSPTLTWLPISTKGAASGEEER